MHSVPTDGSYMPSILPPAISAICPQPTDEMLAREMQERVVHYRSLKDKADIVIIGGAALAIVGIINSLFLLSPPGLPVLVAAVSVIALAILSGGAIFPFTESIFSLSKLAASKIIYRLYSPHFALVSSLALMSMSGVGLLLLGGGLLTKNKLNRKIMQLENKL